MALSGTQGLSWWPSGWSSTRDGGSPAAHASVTMLIESAVTATWSVHASSPWNGLGVASGVHNWQGTPAAAAALSSSATAACAAAGVRREVVTSRLPATRRTAPSAESTKARALSSVSSGASGRCHQPRDTVRPRRSRSHQSTIRAQSEHNQCGQSVAISPVPPRRSVRRGDGKGLSTGSHSLRAAASSSGVTLWSDPRVSTAFGGASVG